MTCQLLTLVSRYSSSKYLTALMYSVPKWNVLLTPLMMSRSTVTSSKKNNIGLPELISKETTPETSSLFLKLFQEMGAEVSILDIDIAHRVSTRNESEGPKPVVCKLVRRLADGESYGSSSTCLPSKPHKYRLFCWKRAWWSKNIRLSHPEEAEPVIWGEEIQRAESLSILMG